MSDPLTPPSDEPEPERRQPPVWNWYVAYCALMAVLYLACLGFGITMLGAADSFREADMEPVEARITGVVLVTFGLPLMVLFAAAPFLPKNRLSWIVGLVAIAIGMTSPCCLPASIPLLIYWLKPETKGFFGM